MQYVVFQIWLGPDIYIIHSSEFFAIIVFIVDV